MPSAETDRIVLEKLARAGYRPKVIYDVGGSNGSWTRAAREFFGETTFELFEPLADHNPRYLAGVEQIRSTPGCRMHAIALGELSGFADLRLVDESGVGSSLVGSPDYDAKKPLRVPVRTLDEMVRNNEIPHADLIKMDVQGGELAALNGASSEVLPHASVLVLESWFVRGYGPETPLAWELIEFLRAFELFPFEMSGEYRNPAGLLISKDIWFARPTSAAGEIIWSSMHESQIPTKGRG